MRFQIGCVELDDGGAVKRVAGNAGKRRRLDEMSVELSCRVWNVACTAQCQEMIQMAASNRRNISNESPKLNGMPHDRRRQGI
jgi:hypothetical protein